jgi:hypothetical protein
MGNILLILTLLTLFGLASVLSKPTPGGDAGMGHAFVLFISGGAFILFSGLFALNIAWNNCFDWVFVPAANRNLMIFIGWVMFIVVVFAIGSLRTEMPSDKLPGYVWWLSRSGAIVWLPILLLVPMLWLLNAERQAGFAPDFVKIPIMTGLNLCTLIAAGLLWGYFKYKLEGT